MLLTLIIPRFRYRPSDDIICRGSHFSRLYDTYIKLFISTVTTPAETFIASYSNKHRLSWGLFVVLSVEMNLANILNDRISQRYGCGVTFSSTAVTVLWIRFSCCGFHRKKNCRTCGNVQLLIFLTDLFWQAMLHHYHYVYSNIPEVHWAELQSQLPSCSNRRLP